MTNQRTVKFILNGRLLKLECYKNNAINKNINTYYCKSIKDVAVLDTGDNNILILINPDFENIVGSAEVIMLYTYYILKMYFEDTNSYIKIDACMANEFGFNKAIDFIKRYETDTESIKKRVGRLERMLVTSVKIIIPNINEILNSFNYINI